MVRTVWALLVLLLAACPAYAQSAAFGMAAAISGNTAFISNSDGNGVGTVFVYLHHPQRGWQFLTELAAADTAPGDSFGHFVQVHDGHAYVGAPGAEEGRGAIYVFAPDPAANRWGLADKLSGDAGASIGGSMARAGDMLIAGARDGGLVTVFVRREGAWRRDRTIAAEAPLGDAGFGVELAADAERLYVGAPRADNHRGAVYVYGLADFVQEAVLMAADTAIAGLGAALVSYGGDRLLVGAPGIAGREQLGVALDFRRGNDGAWAAHQVLAGRARRTADRFGHSMAMSGSTLIIGGGADAAEGAAYVYELVAGGEWYMLQRITQGNIRSFGMTVAMGDGIALIAAPSSGEGDGSVFVYAQVRMQWVPLGVFASEDIALQQLPSEEPHSCVDGVAWQFECSQVDLLAFLPISALGGIIGTSAADIWGWTDPATDREYALFARSDGTAFVDITNPTAPVYLGNLPMTEGARAAQWRDVKVYANHAFVVAGGGGNHGMQVFDLTQLRTVDQLPATFDPTARYDGLRTAHNIVINEDTGFAYAVGSRSRSTGCGFGLHMINIQDPRNPTFAGCFSHAESDRAVNSYAHDAQCVLYRGPDTEHTGKEICFGSNVNALSIADVTDKANPAPIGASSYPNASYAHQGWLTDDHRYFYMNDELDDVEGRQAGTRTLIWDLADLDDPVLAVEFKTDNTATDHNLYIQGDVMYQANYKSGLRIFDISEREKPALIGFFDTFPASDRPGFAGAWSSYPFFKSGTIIVSSMEEGLFILKRQRIDI